LNVLDKILHAGGVETILDAGSGSGILSLAAGRLGCRALGIDNEKAAVDESLRNLVANELEDRVEFRLGSLDDVEGMFDLVAANIYGSVLRAQAGTLSRLTRRHLLLTGFYEPMAAQVLEAYPEMSLAESYTIHEWTVLHLVAPETA
jgi:ribosomal protein L11 methyltransferase